MSRQRDHDFYTRKEQKPFLNSVVKRFLYRPQLQCIILILVETSPPILDINHALFRLRENEVHSKFKSLTTRLRHKFHSHLTNRRLQFPETRLIQYDCGKLQVLHDLIGKLKPDGHRNTGRHLFLLLGFRFLGLYGISYTGFQRYLGHQNKFQ